MGRCASLGFQGFAMGHSDAVVSVSACDVDGDGDVDALSGSFHDSEIAWHENRIWDSIYQSGDDTFESHVVSRRDSSSTASAYGVDVDGDADLDLASVSHDSDAVSWFENDGSQSFSERFINEAKGASAVFALDVPLGRVPLHHGSGFTRPSTP